MSAAVLECGGEESFPGPGLHYGTGSFRTDKDDDGLIERDVALEGMRSSTSDQGSNVVNSGDNSASGSRRDVTRPGKGHPYMSLDKSSAAIEKNSSDVYLPDKAGGSSKIRSGGGIDRQLHSFDVGAADIRSRDYVGADIRAREYVDGVDNSSSSNFDAGALSKHSAGLESGALSSGGGDHILERALAIVGIRGDVWERSSTPSSDVQERDNLVNASTSDYTWESKSSAHDVVKSQQTKAVSSQPHEAWNREQSVDTNIQTGDALEMALAIASISGEELKQHGASPSGNQTDPDGDKEESANRYFCQEIIGQLARVSSSDSMNVDMFKSSLSGVEGMATLDADKNLKTSTPFGAAGRNSDSVYHACGGAVDAQTLDSSSSVSGLECAANVGGAVCVLSSSLNTVDTSSSTSSSSQPVTQLS